MSVDLSKKQFDKDTLILHSVYPQERYFFSISFNEGDKVRIIDPPNDHVKQAFMTAVRVSSIPPLSSNMWADGPARHGQEVYRMKGRRSPDVISSS